jgi:LuxR family maltose regulon positive regulatory protein
VNALLALSLRAEVLQAQGHLHQAAGQFEQVLQLAQEFSIPTAPVTGYALVGLGRTWCEWNDLEAAERYTREGIHYAQKAVILDILLRGWLVLARIRQAHSDFEGALAALENAEPTARQIGVAEIKDWIDAQRVQVWLARGETDAAVNWASSFSGNLDDMIYPSIAITLSKARMAQGRPVKALELLEHALQSAHSVGRLGNAIQILVNKALVQHKQGNRENAYATLSSALALAEPEGYIRVFLDEGDPMRSLISDFRSTVANRGRGRMSDNPKKILEYTKQLLDAFTQASIPFSRNLQSSMLDPLSERELEVLRLMAAGLSNRDIADKDIVSINTVKTQVKSIYGKLGTHTREDTLAAARELGLL